MTTRKILGFSGGKDSTALYLWMLERGLDFEPVYADTGFEAPVTQEYVRALPGRVGGPEVRIIKADLAADVLRKRENLPENWRARGVSEERITRALDLLKPTGIPFLDLCLSRGGFPSPMRRFCTDHLKVRPFVRQVYEPLIDQGFEVESYQGIRRDESLARAKMQAREDRHDLGVDYTIVRPLLDWTVSDVMECLARHGVKPNPLYLAGFSRVGCWPCIHAKKADIAAWADYDPEAVERIRDWEILVSQVTPTQESTFFNGARINTERPIRPETHGIQKWVDWSGTAHGGKQYQMLDMLDRHQSEAEKKWGVSCSTYGVCE